MADPSTDSTAKELDVRADEDQGGAPLPQCPNSSCPACPNESGTMSTPSPGAYFLWELTEPARPRLVGELRKLSNGDVSFQYDATWLTDGYALSPDLPPTTQEYPAVHRHAREKAAPGDVDDHRTLKQVD